MIMTYKWTTDIEASILAIGEALGDINDLQQFPTEM